MPKPKRLKFTRRSSPQAVQRREVLVASVVSEGSGWIVNLVDLSPERLGEEHILTIPEEAPPDGAFAALFRACGMEVSPDREINPREAEGRAARSCSPSSTT